MDLIVKKISNLVEHQFPAFYREDGPQFIQFVKTYYEWLEQENNSLNRSRNFFENRDIDETIDDFLIFFVKKYLYGIPFDVIINKRFLLKHVLDVYRSKGSIQAYKLLFKLIYDKEVDVYIPGRDLLRASDGTWVEPRYIEVSDNGKLKTLLGKTIIGISSRTVAVVENYVKETLNEGYINRLFISNITPKNGVFDIGEKIIVESDLQSANLVNKVNEAPKILGSLSHIEILNGGKNYAIGNSLKIVRNDISNGAIISKGVDGIVKVVSVDKVKDGSLELVIVNSGSGLLANSDLYIYNAATDTTGNGFSFELNAFSDTVNLSYNNDLIVDYYTKNINAVSYAFPTAPSANVSSTLQTALSFSNGIFGSVFTFKNIKSGNSYTATPKIFVRSTIKSNTLTGNISYSTSSANITGTSTTFASVFANNDVIYLQANSTNANTIETQIIKQVVNNTVIVLYGKPKNSSTSSATYRAAADIIPANFAPYQNNGSKPDGTRSGVNALLEAYPNSGNNVIKDTAIINSGIGYAENELVKMYLYGAINDPTIVSGGSGYSNGDLIVFSGGDAENSAKGFVSTNGSGVITSVNISDYGSGYKSVPNIIVKTENGSGAKLTTTLAGFNLTYEVIGRVQKAGIGKQKGYWTTSKGFLNSDKYLQDSFFYQDFSYQLQTAISLDKYKNILYNTFHIAGTELFGDYLILDSVAASVTELYASNSAIIT